MTAIVNQQQLSPNYVIDASKPSHLAWWAAAFDVPEYAVIEAVQVVGPQATEVFRYLHRDAAQPPDRSVPHHSWDRRRSDRRGTDRRANALEFRDEVLAGEAHHGSEQR